MPKFYVKSGDANNCYITDTPFQAAVKLIMELPPNVGTSTFVYVDERGYRPALVGGCDELEPFEAVVTTPRGPAKPAQYVYDIQEVFKAMGIETEGTDEVCEFEVWMEGFQATGQSAQATLLGTFPGADFKDAVIQCLSAKGMLDDNFNEERMTYWGCKLCETEEEARRSFG